MNRTDSAARANVRTVSRVLFGPMFARTTPTGSDTPTAIRRHPTSEISSPRREKSSPRCRFFAPMRQKTGGTEQIPATTTHLWITTKAPKLLAPRVAVRANLQRSCVNYPHLPFLTYLTQEQLLSPSTPTTSTSTHANATMDGSRA